MSNPSKPKTLKKKRDPNKPKAPQTAFFWFSADHRQEARAQLGEGALASEVAMFLGKKWRGLPDDDKLVYQQKADSDRVRYKAEMAVYEPPAHEENVSTL